MLSSFIIHVFLVLLRKIMKVFHSRSSTFYSSEFLLLKGRPYQYKKFSKILTKKICMIVSCREKQLEEKWHLRMFVIWPEQICNHRSILKNTQSVLYFHNGPRNIARELYTSQVLQIQTIKMSFRKIVNSMMTAMVMNKNNELNLFNKLKVSCFICNWF